MSKTIFEPKAKTMSLAEGPEIKEVSVLKEKETGPDSYESIPASKWKSMAGSSTYDLGSLSGAASELGNVLQQSLGEGMLGQNAQVTTITNPLALSTKRAAKNEYLQSFKPVELPPSAIESIAMYPDGENAVALKDAIVETVAYYDEYMGYFNARKGVAEKALASGNISPNDANILRQFLGKLNEAIEYTQKQVDIVSSYEKGNIEGK